jgi:hypothetical protein
MATRMQQRRGTAEQWTGANPRLNAGEIGYETDTNKFKIGDGVTLWDDLNYFADADTIGGSIDDYIPLTQRNTANGVATLDANGKVPLDQLGNLIDGAPDALNTLNELAAALGDNEDFATNLTTTLGNKQDKVTGVSDAEIGYLANVTSDIQTQLNNKLASADLDEAAQEAVNTALVAGTGLDKTYDDNANTITIDIDSTVATKTYADAAVSTHNDDTENVHGIANTALLATKEYADTAEADAITAAGTAADGKISTAVAALTKSSVGLGNVDNTSDANKPVSSATQTALDLKANLAGPTFTGTVVLPSTTSVGDVSATELGYVNGVTSAIQTQLDDKLSKTGGTMTGALTLSADPSASLHAVTKQYVDNTASGVVAKPQVLAATSTNLSATYSNGTAGVGATLTHTSNGVWPTTVAGATGWVIGSGLLVKNQTNKAHNGRYFLSDLGSASTPWVLTRCGYCDEADEIPGAYVFVQGGTLAGTGWIQTVADPATFVVGTDDINVFQFSGSGTITAGTGITVSGNEVSISSGAITSSLILDGTIVDADVNASAAIAQSKISGLTSDLAAKANLAGPTFTGTVVLPGTTSIGNVSATELGFVDGVTSAIQTQLDAKIAKSDISAKGAILVGTGSGTYTAQTVGTNGQVLTANSAQADGVEWTTISGYSAPTLGSTSIASGATVSTIAGLTLSGATLTGTLTAGGGVGTSGQLLSSTATGVQWINAPTGYSAPTLGSTSIDSGATVTTIAGLTLTSPVINNPAFGYETRTAANTTTTLTASSTRNQYITGSTAHTFRLPVASTMLLGQTFNFTNRISTNNVVRIETSDGSFLGNLFRGQTLQLTCILTSGTSSASWTSEIIGFEPGRTTGSGPLVFQIQPYLESPTFNNPNIQGNLSINGYTTFQGSLNLLGSTGNTGQVVGKSSSGLIEWITPGAGGGTLAGDGAERFTTSDVSIGDYAGYGNSQGGSGVVNLGAGAGSYLNFPTYSSVHIGPGAGQGSGGEAIVAIGNMAGTYQNPSTTGLFGDIFIGFNAGSETYNRSGNRNTVIGYRSGGNLTSGSNNTFIGYESAQGGGGYSAITGVQTGSNNIVIGYQARPSSNSVSNQITLGNNSISSLRCNVTSISGLSDERDKTNIENLPIGIDFINSLRPVKFEWDTRDESKVGVEDFGFIAQEVMEAEDAINAHDWLALTLRDNEEKYELAPAKLVPILVKAIQDLSEEIKTLKNNNNLN